MIYYLLLGAATGAAAGSAATALADRYQRPREFLIGRSACPHCHRQLTAFELIPIVSWLVQRGRCRSCNWPIGWVTLALEIGFALAGVLAVFQLGLSWSLGWLWLALIGLGALILVDITDQLLPDRLILGTLPFLILFSAASPMVGLTLKTAVIGLLIGGGLLGLLWLGTKGRGLGLGDVKLSAVFGLALGHPLILVVLMVAFVSGGAYAAGLLATGRAKLGQQVRVAFGPFLILGYLVALLAGRQLLTWYGLV